MLNIKNDLSRFEGMHLQRKSLKSRLLIFITAFALIGTYFLIRSFALEPDLNGELLVSHYDNFEDGTTKLSYVLKTSDDKKIPVEISGANEDQFVTGPAVIKNVDKNAKALKTPASNVKQSAQAKSSSGAKKVAIIMFRFPSDPLTPQVSADRLLTDIFTGPYSDNAFFKEESGGALTLSGIEKPAGDIFGYYEVSATKIPDSAAKCVDSQYPTKEELADNLDAIAKSKGHDVAKYDQVVYVTPHNLCGAGGIASFAKRAWATLQPDFTWKAAAHELTHNLGLAHANALHCVNNSNTTVPISDNCKVEEYGDPYDVMGSNSVTSPLIGHSNNYYLSTLGWLNSSNTSIVKTSGTYTLTPVESSSRGIKLLRIYRGPVSSGGQYYNLEYRQPIGTFDSVLQQVAIDGAIIRLDHIEDFGGQTGGKPMSGLIIMNSHSPDPNDPENNLKNANASMRDGQLLVDQPKKISIKQISHSASGVKLQINIGATANDTTPPTQVTGLTAASFITIGPADTIPIQLEWNASTDNTSVASYDVYRSTSATTGFSIIGQGQPYLLSASGEAVKYSYSDNVSGSTTYYYYVIANDVYGNKSPKSATVSYRTTGPDTTPPSAPTAVRATAASQTQINLTWTASTDNVGVDHYIIKRNGNQVGTSATASYRDTGLTAAQTYTYSIFAVDAAGNQNVFNASQTASGTTQAPDTTPPTAPYTVRASGVSSSQINLTWYASTDNIGVDHYQIYRNGNSIGTTTSSVRSFSDTGLSPATTYTYSVYAYDAAGNHNVYTVSQTATGRTLGTPPPPGPDTSAPSTPTNFVAAGASSSQINLSWRASTDNVGVDHYLIYRDGSPIGQTAATAFNDTGVISGTHSYSVSAYDAAGNFSPGAAATGSTTANVIINPPPTPLAAPTNLSAISPSKSQINLSWTPSKDSAGGNIFSYEIHRGSTNLGTFYFGSTGYTFGDTGLTQGTSYTYQIYAVDDAGNKSPPASVTGTTQGTVADKTPPSTPTNFTATEISANSIKLSWSPSTDNVGVAGYNILLSPMVQTSATSYIVTGLYACAPGLNFSVQAFDNSNNVSGWVTAWMTGPLNC